MKSTGPAGRIGIIALWSLFASGCATTNSGVVDKMPQGAPKGYAEFYAAEGDTLGQMVSVSQLKGPKGKEVENFGQFTGVRRLTVACPPGENYIILQLGRSPPSQNRSPIGKLMAAMTSNARQVVVQVQEGMVTPVRLTFTKTSETGDNFMRQVSFTWKVTFDSPQAFTDAAR